MESSGGRGIWIALQAKYFNNDSRDLKKNSVLLNILVTCLIIIKYLNKTTCIKKDLF